MADTKPAIPTAMAKSAPTVGWLEDLGYYDDVGVQCMRTLLYGAMGTGKTTLLATFPGVFIIDTDAGGMTIRKKHVRFVPCYEAKGIIKRVLSILAAAKSHNPPFDKGDIKTIALDSISVFSNSAIVDLIAQTGRDPMEVKAGYDEYGRLLNVQLAIGKLLKSLSREYNIVVTALPTVDKDENTGSMIGGPLLVGQYRNLIGADFDEVYYLATEGTKDNVKHVLYTSKTSFFDAKTRIGGLPYKMEDPTYDKLAKFL